MRSILYFILMLVTRFCYSQDTTKYITGETIHNMEIGSKIHGKYDGLVLTYQSYLDENHYRIVSKEYFRLGQKFGPDTFFYEEGNTSQIYKYTSKGIHSTTFFKNGQIESIGYYDNYKKIGTWNSFYESGKIKEVCDYKNDMIEGSYIYFFENGNLFETGSYVNGFKTGIWIEGDSSGKIISKGNYLPVFKDYFEPIVVQIDPNDTTFKYCCDTISTRSFGVKDGVWTIYDNQKNEIRKVNYIKGDMKK
jgi:antitoxin component YwqK of YwqJK toxin-antitoxin module